MINVSTASLLCFLVLLTSCNSYNAEKSLNKSTYNKYFRQLSPYVLPKPDEVTFEDRFHNRLSSYYESIAKSTTAQLRFHQEADTAHFFFYEYKDLSSLFEHYRGMGGYFRTNEADSIVYVNLLYFTPRLTREEMDHRGKALFEEMVSKGNLKKYFLNKDFIQTPNADFYYNDKENRWDYTPNSSWKFLQEEQQRYDSIKN